MQVAVARAHPNIAFIKYWGNQDDSLRIPVNSSLSMNLSGLYSETRVSWDENATADSLMLNGKQAPLDALVRVQLHMAMLREYLGLELFAHVESQNNFPTGAGIASSASAFAALTLAAVRAAGHDADQETLSTLARLGSGSASRSIPSGFVEWHMGDSHETSYAESFASKDHWELTDVIAVVSQEHKAVTSRQGHQTASTSDLQQARVANANSRLKICKQAIMERDFIAFSEVTELDSNLMHAVMMTSHPPLFYWRPESLALMEVIREWRREGLNVCYTLDAGPNVHCLCLPDSVDEVRQRLEARPAVEQIFIAKPAAGAHLI